MRGLLIVVSAAAAPPGGYPHLHFHVSTPLQAHADPKFEAYRTFPTVFSTNSGTELLEPNHYLVQ